MRKTRTLATLVVTIVCALAVGGYAYAHALGFESDLSGDGAVNVCNPEGIQASRVATAIEEWNAATARWNRPTLRDVSNSGELCELEVARQGGDQATYYARIVFTRHPDVLQISERFADLSDARKQGITTHEFGHVLGLTHPDEGVSLCEESVMTTIANCRAEGVSRRSTPGPHDEADLLDYWVDEPSYPVANKCWTNEDENGDGLCDRRGSPTTGTLGAQDLGGAEGRNVSGDQLSALSAPQAVED